MNNNIENSLHPLYDILLTREAFVKLSALLIHNDDDVYSSQLHEFKQRLKYLPKLIELVNQLPRERYQFSFQIEILLAVCDTYPLLHENMERLNNVCQHPEKSDYPEFKPYLSDFLIQIRFLFLNCSRQALNEARREAERNLKRCIIYIDEMFNRWSRLVIIRIDLSYKKELVVEFDELENDLKTLHTNRRHNSLFSDLCGYILKIEYGLEKKLHVHVLLFFNGHKRLGNADSYIAQQIGEYWVEVTNGGGTYWNCNANKTKYHHIGIGLVEAYDTNKRENLLKAVAYLCKKEIQVIKPRDKPKTKLLRKGQLPKMPVKLGRPREHDNV
jgi:hypothetical protein